MQRVLVTGASGFVGGHVVRRLAGSMEVRALVRNPAAQPMIDLLGVRISWVSGDLKDEGSLQAAVEGCDLVVHAATDTAFRNRRESTDVSVGGTRRLYKAARSAGVRRFVFVSSAAVYLGTPGRSDEDGPLLPSGDLYGDQKVEAERFLGNAPPGGPEVVILRPPSIHGPGSRWSIQPMTAARAGRAFLPMGGAFPFPVVYIDNFVDAVEAALSADGAAGTYNIFDAIPTYAEYYTAFCSEAGTRPRSLPYALLWLVAVGSELVNLTGRYAPLTRRSLRGLLGSPEPGPYSRERARRSLGWEPRVSHTEAMAHSLKWLRQAGY